MADTTPKISTYTPEYLNWYNFESDIPWLWEESLEISNLWWYKKIVGELNGAYSRIEQTDAAIALEVSNRITADSWLSSLIVIEAGRITQEVSDRVNWEAALQASITVEADRITQEVTDRTNADGVLNTSITQTANEIVLKASDSDTVKANVVVSSINWGTVKIDAKNINISWTTTFSSWYDPTTKETPAWAQVKADAALSSANNYTDALENNLWDIAYLDLVSAAKLDSTVIQWWYIKTSLINASALAIWDFSGDIGDINGDLDDISDWSVHKRVTSNEKTGADRAYGALNSNDRYTNWLASNDITETKSTSWYTGVFIDSTWLKGYDGGTKTFEIDSSSGDAYFSWEIGWNSATISWDVEIVNGGSIFIWGTWSGMDIWAGWFLGIQFTESNQDAWSIYGSAFVNVAAWSFSTTLTGIVVSRDLILDQDLFVEDDLIVKDNAYIGWTLHLNEDLDMQWNNIDDVDNIYINDLYAQWSFIYIRDPIIFSWSTTTLTIPTWTSSSPENNWTATIYYDSSTNKIWIYDGWWKWTAALT